MLRGDIGYADGYNGKSLPFYKVFYAGGVGSVRATKRRPWARAIFTGTRSAGKLKIVGNGAFLSDHQGGQVGARERIRGCRADLGLLTIACEDAAELCAEY
jgi:outer membrane protein insertion porin family